MNVLKEEQITALFKICDWIENTYSKYGYVDRMGEQIFVNQYLNDIRTILLIGHYDDRERGILNQLRERYIKRDLGAPRYLGVDDSLPF